MTLKVTLPCGALLRESVNLNSFAVTLTVVVFALVEPRVGDDREDGDGGQGGDPGEQK